MAASLSHPHIVPIHRVSEARGFVFFVMSYVDGETLGDRIRTRGPLPPAEVTRVMREVAWALAYAHGRGIVHRDVKPNDAECVDIAATVDGFAAGLFGAHEVRGPHDFPGVRHVHDIAFGTRDAEIRYQRISPTEQNIPGLDIAVYDAVPMRMRERVEYITPDV